jgi:uncharacterized membrane protein
MNQPKVLLVGESWVSTSIHFKGWDHFQSTYYEEGADHLLAALRSDGIEVDHLRGHEAARGFPLDLAGLQAYDVVILSDIGANTLLLHPDAFLRGERVPNRLKLIAEYVAQGGGLLMAGGYLSFQGINAAAQFHATPIEEVLPVTMLAGDDRMEVPEGADPEVVGRGHEVLSGIDGAWPYLLGFNRVAIKEGATLLATAEGHPLLVVGTHGRGRSAAWASDVGPHWCPMPFVSWEGYARLFQNLIRWLAAERLG